MTSATENKHDATTPGSEAESLCASDVAFLTLDADWHFTSLNAAAETLLGRSRDSLLGRVAWDEFPQFVGGPSYREYHRALAQRCAVLFEEFYPPDRWLEVHAYPIGETLGVYFSDVTMRKNAALELVRVNRALQLISRCNEALIRATHERTLLDRICQIAVETGGYRTAWVAYRGDDENKSLSIQTFATPDADRAFLEQLDLSWSAERPQGQGPAGQAFRSGEPVVVDEISADAASASLQHSARQRDFAGAVYLPLQHGSDTFGVLALYSAERFSATHDELKLLRELADNLAFGIGNIRGRTHQRQLEATVLKVAASVSAHTGEKFFEQLARNMAEAVGAYGAFVSRLLPEKPGMARTVIGVAAGATVDNFDYTIAHAPCGMVLAQKQCVIEDAVGERFPESAAAALGARAYGGFRLDDADGRPLGLLFVLFQHAVRNTELITSTLQIFAARAGSELERQETDARVREQAALLDKARDAIVVRSLEHRILFWNKGAERLYGWTAEDALGRTAQDLLGDNPQALQEAYPPVLADGDWSGEISRRTKHGANLTVETRWTLISDDAGLPRAILSIDTDITRRKQIEQEIQRLALHDALTGLPNRVLMLDRLKHAVAGSAHGQRSGALLLIDLDNFKAVNDTLGHDRGDLLLQRAASRLQVCVDDGDTVARLGGDEFVVILENLSPDPDQAALRTEAVAADILSAMTQPFLLDDGESFISCSIGAALFSRQASAPGDLLKHADMAMYRAKAAGRNTLRFFDPDMQTSVLARSALEADLRHAVRNKQFDLHFQPQVDEDGSISGAEALLRWQHPTRGYVSPAIFVPLAEESGVIVALGEWVLDTACAQMAQWARQAATADLCMSVNVSARQLQHPGFVKGVTAALQRAQADPHKLKIELTESLLVENVETTITKMTALRQLGVRFSLDDFGTGYSSLAYLKRLPLDQLKIDQSFVRDILTDPNDAAIARTVLALGKNLGLSVIAEGVETEQQRQLLAECGCSAYQGYLFSPAISASEFDNFVAAHARQRAQRGA
ncbi:MAG TPA: EAL domain-containing protein [Telluria sp.]